MSSLQSLGEAITSSKKDDWQTPWALYLKIEKVFGKFTLDAAASSSNRMCTRYYSVEQDSLMQPWSSAVWVNPPYGRKVGRWVDKAIKSIEGDCDRIVMLLPARPDTKWFQRGVEKTALTLFIRGRVKFVGAATGAPFPSVLLVFAKDLKILDEETMYEIAIPMMPMRRRK